MATGLHITLTTFTHGSRILKETASLVESGLVQHVHIVALYGIARLLSAIQEQWPKFVFPGVQDFSNARVLLRRPAYRRSAALVAGVTVRSRTLVLSFSSTLVLEY